MAVTPDQIRTEYPLPVYNFRVEIGGDTVAFSEVSGLSVHYDVTTYKESPTAAGAVGPRVMHMPAQRGIVTVSLKKGIVRQSSIKSLYGWIRTVQVNQVEKRDVFVRLCDDKGQAVMTWKVGNAFPVKLDAPTFDAKSNDVAIESMELKADYVTVEES